MPGRRGTQEENGAGGFAVDTPCQWGEDEVPSGGCDKGARADGGGELGLGGRCLSIYGTRGDEVLWTMHKVDVDVNGTEVAGVVLKNLEAVWGVGSVVGCWVKNKQSAYIVVHGIPEREWLSEVGGTQGQVGGT